MSALKMLAEAQPERYVAEYLNGTDAQVQQFAADALEMKFGTSTPRGVRA